VTIRLALLLLAGALHGCSGIQSTWNAQGHSAEVLKHLMLGIIGVCTLIWLLVVLMLVAALLKRRRQPPLQGEQAERKTRLVVYVAVAATTIIVAGLTLVSFYATRDLVVGRDMDLTVRIKGQQWWWQVTYNGSRFGPGFQTANELHIPVGRNVRLELESIDVIHSFWVPSLAGKQDMIPGRMNVLTLRAERPGVYRGQCAEFCGLQHSHMALMVVAEDDDQYRRWAQAQAIDAAVSDDTEVEAGRAVFMSKPCAACHTVRGTDARGSSGPDLTHVGGRRTIAAGLLETTRGSLAAWIADPQTLKPGTNMPIVPLTSEELQQVSAYMEALK
jgi:cytochrome c oxidase subunit 2